MTQFEFSNNDDIKKLAISLCQHLRAQGVDNIKQSMLLEGIAKFAGAKDWNTLSAENKKVAYSLNCLEQEHAALLATYTVEPSFKTHIAQPLFGSKSRLQNMLNESARTQEADDLGFSYLNNNDTFQRFIEGKDIVVNNMCMRYRHDIGLLPEDIVEMVKNRIKVILFDFVHHGKTVDEMNKEYQLGEVTLRQLKEEIDYQMTLSSKPTI